MALIRCPECGKEISDKAQSCIGCGYPIDVTSYGLQNTINSLVAKYPDDMTAAIKEYRAMSNCTLKAAIDIFEPIYKGKKTPGDVQNFDGVYRFSLWSGKKEVYCPRCRSSNCGFYHQYIPERKKISYTLNLNPLKLFTFANQKEKVIQKARVDEQFVCNDCGKIFK